MNKIKSCTMAALLLLVACSEKQEPDVLEMVTPTEITLDVRCQQPSIAFSAPGKWTIESSAQWITPIEVEGSGNAEVELYAEQNDSGIVRSAIITIAGISGDKLEVTVTQMPADENSQNLVYNLPKTYGLGWGYDYAQGHAEESGLRGQILNEESLRRNYDKDNAVMSYVAPGVDCKWAYSESLETLKEKIGGSVGVGVNLFVASARVNVEFSKQTTDTKHRIFVWFNDLRWTHVASLTVNYGTSQKIKKCFTEDFMNAVENVKTGKITPAKFVDKYGTHLIVKSWLGGKMEYWYTISQDIHEEITEVTTTITAKFLFFKTTHTSHHEDIWKKIQNDFTGSFYVRGGGTANGSVGRMLSDALELYCNQKKEGMPESKQHLISDWQDLFYDAQVVDPSNLTIVHMESTPIWNMVKKLDQTVADKIQNFIETQYCQ